MKLLTLSGLDGSGKSTQIELLKDYLKSKDKTFFYFHAVEFSVGNKMLKKNKIPLSPPFRKGEIKGADSLPFEKGEAERDLDKSVTKASWLQIQMRKIALMIDIIRFKCLTNKLAVDYIISDRYFYDSVVNIDFLSGRNKYRLVECFVPKPDFAFYISVKPETIMQRDRKPDQGLEYLVAKEKLFQEKIKDWDMITLDGEREKEKIFSEIKSKINV